MATVENEKAVGFDPLNQIIKSKDETRESVLIPEWGLTVEVFSPGGAARAEFDEHSREWGDSKGRLDPVRLRGLTFSLAVCGAKPLNDDGDFKPWSMNLKQGMEIAKKSAIPVERLFDACLRMLGLAPTEVKQRLEKNQHDD